MSSDSVVAAGPTDGVGHSVAAGPPPDCAYRSVVAEPPPLWAVPSVVAEPHTNAVAEHSVAGSFGIAQPPDSDVHSGIGERTWMLREGYHCVTESDIYTIVTRVNTRTQIAADEYSSDLDEDELFDIQITEIRRCLTDLASGARPAIHGDPGPAPQNVDYGISLARVQPTNQGPAPGDLDTMIQRIARLRSPTPILVQPTVPGDRWTIYWTPLRSTVAVEARDHPSPDLPGLPHHALVRRETLRAPVHPYGGCGGRNGGGGGSSGGGGN